MVELTDPMVPTIAGADRSLRRWIGLGVLLTAIFVAALDNFIVFVAIPSIRSNLGATFAQAEFIVAGYTLAFALGLITSARLGDRFGRRRMFLIGFTSFTVASGLCGAAPTPSSLIVFRVVQGVAGAMLTPQMLAIIRVTFIEARERATAFAWMGVAIGLGGVLGQVVGGFVVSADFFGLSWRPVFLINLPVGIFALTVGPFVIDESHAPGVQRFDLVGAALSSLGLGLLLYPLVEGREAGWPSWAWAMLVASSIVLGVFVVHQHRKSLAKTSPLLDTELFFDRAFCIGLVLILLFYGTISPLILSFSYLLQLGYGQSPVASALYFSPLAISFVITNLSVGRFGGADARRTLMAGAIICAFGYALTYAAAAFIPAFAPGLLVPGMVLLGLGQGLFMTPVVNAVLSEIPEQHTGAASGVLNTMQRVGNALGVAVLELPFFATFDQARLAGATMVQSYTSAFAVVIAWLAVVMVAVIVLLRFLPSGRVAA